LPISIQFKQLFSQDVFIVNIRYEESRHRPSLPIKRLRTFFPEIGEADSDFLNRIGVDYDANPGRIFMIKTGRRFADILPAP